MKKRYKFLIAIVLALVILSVLDSINEHLHVKLINKFTNNYTYLPLSEHRNNEFEKSYYCEYLDSFERMWYQNEELDFINDTTFQMTTKSTYFLDYFFQLKYYLGVLDLKQLNDNVNVRYIIRNNYVFTAKTDSLVGTLKKVNNKIIFKYDRP